MKYEPAELVSDSATQRELQRVAASLNNIYAGKLRVMPVAPAKPSDGQIVICNGTTWDPLGDGIKRPIWYDAGAQLWKSFT